MPRFVALLRGVNVGKGKRVPMAEWRRLLEDLGYRDVETLLNSGNAVFESPGRSTRNHGEAIRLALQKSLGLEVPVIVKSAAELAAIQEENTLAREAPDPTRLLVAFTAEPADLQSLAGLAALAVPPERFLLGRHAAYLWCPAGILESQVAESLLGKAGRAATTRNWATVTKIRALLDR
ncbi:MAG: DUF1697 domain-containing protein [Verrucomicrobia bacterium]|nr:DUF1697 domain-containing protein [Verrucomicrobiota bacterium]